MKKKLALLLALVMILTTSVGILTGCNKPQEQTDELQKNVTVKVYSWWDPAHKGILALQEGFEKEYADYNVKLEFVKISDYYKTMLTKLAGKKLAGGSDEQIDVMMLAFDKIPLFAQNGTIIPLDDLASKEYLDSLYPVVKDGIHFNGHIYAVARDITANCAILNKDVFAKYNIELPGEDWTMADFMSLCAQFAAKSTQAEPVWGYTFGTETDRIFPWLYLYGGKFFDPDKDASLMNTPEAKAGFNALYGLIQNGGAMSPAQSAEYNGWESAFASGYAAMEFGGLSAANKAETNGANFTVRPLPIGVSGEHQSHIFINCWTIPECTTQKAWAWKVLEYFSGAKGQTAAVNAGMGLPSTPNADITSWVAASDWRQYYVDALNYSKTQPYQTDTFGPNWDTNFSKLTADAIWNVSGLTAEQVNAELEKMNGSLSYYLMGGS